MARILLVDDNALERKDTEAALKAAGHKVDTSPNTKDAQRQLRDCSYDVLLTDWAMMAEPRQPGAGAHTANDTAEQLIRWAKEECPDMAIIACTRSGFDEVKGGGYLSPSSQVGRLMQEFGIRRWTKAEKGPTDYAGLFKIIDELLARGKSGGVDSRDRGR